MMFRGFLLRNASRLACLALAVALLLAWTGCGENYRPVATPIIPIAPNPGFTHFVVVLSSNGLNDPGASTTIDVSGDTAISQATVGVLPSWAFILSGSKMYVTNSLDDTISVFLPSSPLGVATVSLPAGSGPVYLTSTETDPVSITPNSVYVANAGNNTVSIVSQNLDAVTATVPVGVKPVALAELPRQGEVFVANEGSGGLPGSVNSINTVDDTVNPPIAACASAPWQSPVAIAARSDSDRVYVLDQGSGYVTAISTSSGTTTSTVVGCAPVGAGANFMNYDSALNRLYIANPTTQTLSIVDASQQTFSGASVLDVISFAAGSAACPSGCSPLSATIIPPLGGPAYVATAAVSGGQVTSSVTVVNTTTFAIQGKVPLTTVPQSCVTDTPFELYTAASADGTRVYVGNCDAGSTFIINTATNTLESDMLAPLSAARASALVITGASQNGGETTYSYRVVAGSRLRIGMTVVVQNMGDSSNDGTFTIVGLAPGTFTVVNTFGVSAAGQQGTAIALAPQSPIFVVAGP
ncbi:MAG TPA: YncE family protein [Terriglobales bacterium]